MFEEVGGLPVHVLVVHAVVVLLPLACLGAVAVASVPRWNERFGVLVVWCALVGAIAAYVAAQSGRALAERLGTPQDHQRVAQWVPWFAFALLAVVVIFWWSDRRARYVRSRATILLAVVTAVLALTTLGWVIVAGHSGATAVWGNTL